MAVSAQTQKEFPCSYCGAFLIVELAVGVYNKVVCNLLRFLKSLELHLLDMYNSICSYWSGMSVSVYVLDRDAIIGLIDLANCRIILVWE